MTDLTPVSALTPHEQLTKRRCDLLIEKGRRNFMRMSRTLVRYNKQKLYRDEFKTFEDYVQFRFGMGARRAYQLIAASLLSTKVRIENERQARELKHLPDDLQPLAWDMAKRFSAQMTPGKPVPSTLVKSAVSVVKQAMTTGGYVDLGDGKMTALDAALIQEVDENKLRQRQHIRDSIDSKFKQERLVDYLPFVVVKINKPARRIVIEVEDSDSGKIALNAINESMLNLRLSIVARVPVEKKEDAVEPVPVD